MMSNHDSSYIICTHTRTHTHNLYVNKYMYVCGYDRLRLTGNAIGGRSKSHGGVGFQRGAVDGHAPPPPCRRRRPHRRSLHSLGEAVRRGGRRKKAVVSGATAAARGTHTHARALWQAWPDSALCVEPAMARMLAILAGLDSSGVARSAVSSGDSCGGRRQVGTASHVNRGRSFVWLHASVCVVRVSLWMPASECAQSIKRNVRGRLFPDRTV